MTETKTHFQFPNLFLVSFHFPSNIQEIPSYAVSLSSAAFSLSISLLSGL